MELENAPAANEAAEDSTEKERRAKLAAERRAKILAQMAAQQNSFIKENAKLFEHIGTEIEAEQMDESPCPDMDVTETEIVALGPRQSSKIVCDNTFR